VKGFDCSWCRIGDKHLEERSALALEEVVRGERVSRFCYLGDIIEKEGGSDGAIAGKIAKGWRKYKMLSPLLGSRSIPKSVKGKLYAACVRSCMLYGSETWTITLEGQRRLELTDRQMIRMCGVTLKNRI
jgi:hypothetical protein